MELQFEYMQEIGAGEYPDVWHTRDNAIFVFHIKGNKVLLIGGYTPSGELANIEFTLNESLPETFIEYFEVYTVNGSIMVCCYKSLNKHKIIIIDLDAVDDSKSAVNAVNENIWLVPGIKDVYKTSIVDMGVIKTGVGGIPASVPFMLPSDIIKKG